jgi:maltooligosyltrehalose synthase
VERWEDGRIKMYLTHRALALRSALPALFRDGEYLPLAPAGERAQHVFAFARRGAGAEVVVAVPRLVATLMRGRDFALPEAEDWRGTRVAGGGGMLRGPLAQRAHRRGAGGPDGRGRCGAGGGGAVRELPGGAAGTDLKCGSAKVRK